MSIWSGVADNVGDLKSMALGESAREAESAEKMLTGLRHFETGRECARFAAGFVDLVLGHVGILETGAINSRALQ